ncbi:kinase-like domain-containing protein [Pterulicium gracile]|uniref:cAMP-dependent protein kinase n=1 Tax=Pterulicium gracile TaxID=1884261 RepID=A0A5C3R6T2_9AGAR|nr:kinase-like domain-containing protein [Pterula gracilis]
MEVDVDTQSSQASLAEVPNSQAVASEGTSSPNPAPRRQSTLSASHSEQPGPQAPLRILEDEQVHIERRGRLRLTDFQVKGSLGTGTFGRVLLVRYRASNPGSQSYFAMKVLKKTEIVRQRQVEHVNAERYILSRVRHPFIVDLYATFQDSMNIYMLLSYVPGGELFTHLRRARQFTPDVTRFYLATIILALKFLHSFNIIYRDLKPENLLLDSRGYLRLTDFGFAKVVDDRTWTVCGTPEYLAPEIIQSDGHGKAADWWACGILCYEMLVGHPPFFDDTAYGIYEKILAGHVHYPRAMDRLSKEIIKGFLEPDRSMRLGNMIGGPQDVLEHPWFRGVDWDALERREISAPIIPFTTSMDDTRHFLHIPPPLAEDIPGLLREEGPVPVQQKMDPLYYQFLEF